MAEFIELEDCFEGKDWSLFLEARDFAVSSLFNSSPVARACASTLLKNLLGNLFKGAFVGDNYIFFNLESEEKYIARVCDVPRIFLPYRVNEDVFPYRI